MNDRLIYDEMVKKSPTSHQYIYTTETLLMFNDIIPKYKKILDLGCGTGHIAEMLGDRDWYGVDISPLSIEIAKRFYREAKVGDITKNIPFPDSSFDVVLALSILHHIPDSISETIDEVKRVLKPEGEFIIIDHDDRDTHTRLMHSGLLRLVPCKTERALDPILLFHFLLKNNFELNKFKEIRIHADQQALKPHFLVRLVKVPLLMLASFFGTKTKGDFLLRARCVK